jgi:hypothetical protein
VGVYEIHSKLSKKTFKISKFNTLKILKDSMNTTDYKLDAVLRCLHFYYKEFVYANEIYNHTGDKRDKEIEFVTVGLISAWLDFSETERIDLTKAEILDLLTHLENDKLIISKFAENNKQFKINSSGIALLESNGYVRRNKRTNREYIMKRSAILISIISLLISLATLIYTLFFKR